LGIGIQVAQIIIMKNYLIIEIYIFARQSATKDNLNTECNNKILKVDKSSYQIYEYIDKNNLCSGGGFYSDAHNKCFPISYL
jgi:hypothetical protein